MTGGTALVITFESMLRQYIYTTCIGITLNNLFYSHLPDELSVKTVNVCPPTLCKTNGCSLGALTEAGFPPIS